MVQDQLSFYGHVPLQHSEIFLTDPHQLFELSHDLSVANEFYLSVDPDEFVEIDHSGNLEDIETFMQYIPKIREYALNHHVVSGPNARIVPENRPFQWDVECPFVLKKFHFQEGYRILHNAVGDCGNALEFIRSEVRDLPDALQIGQGQSFFTGNNSILANLRRLSEVQNPLDCEPIFTALFPQCAQLQGYTDWAATLHSRNYIDMNSDHIELFVNVGSSLQ